MATRNRSYTIRYGGWLAGTSQGGELTEPAFLGVHSCYDETHPGPPYNSGGPLSVRKLKVWLDRSGDHYVFYHALLGWYRGHMGVRPYIPPTEPTPSDLSGWGAKGWNRTYPLHPIYQLGVSLLELKDFRNLVNQTRQLFGNLNRTTEAFASGTKTVRDFLKVARGLPKNSASTYLGGAFGWAPMLQDLLFLLKMQEKLAKKLAWLRRNNGKSIRRRIELDKSEWSENIARSIAPSSSVFPALAQDCYAAGQNVNVSMPILKSFQRRIWFSVKWKIAIPEIYLPKRPSGVSNSLVNTLLGLEPNVGVLYKVMPWSWLLDWFTSVGDVTQNMSHFAKYGVVAEYAYVMCSESYTYSTPGRVTLHSGKQVGFQWVDPDWTYSGVSQTVYEFRTREEANPYGFGITWKSLTGFQWSILVALGLTHGGFHSATRA